MNESPKKKQRRSCWPFDRDRPAPDEKEKARLLALDQDGEEWGEERKKRIGASTSCAAVGLDFATPKDYWKIKTHHMDREDTEEGLAIMSRGHKLEPVAADVYELIMQPRSLLKQVGIIVHPDIPWIHCSPDRVFENTPEGCVEIKCPVFALPIRIKTQYMCQVQQQLACMDKEWCDLFYYLHDDETDCPQGVTCWRIYRSKPYWKRMVQSLRVMADCLMDDRPPTTEDIPLRPTMPFVEAELLVDYEFDDECKAMLSSILKKKHKSIK